MLQLIRTAADLERALPHETARIEFKQQVDPNDREELAKDVAAFANSVGGTILVGAIPNGARLVWKPMTKEESAKAMRAYDEAVRDRCSPKPLLEFFEIEKDGGFVLAVNVWAFPGQPVGVLVGENSAKTYRFPLRSGAQTVYLTPDQLPMMMLPEVRRVAILLSQIPQPQRGQVMLNCINRSGSTTFRNEMRLELDDYAVVMRNTVSFELLSPRRSLALPADSIASVWQSAAAGSQWNIVVRAEVRDRDGLWQVTPW